MPDTNSSKAPFTYTAETQIELDGKAIDQKVIEDILQIAVEESLHLPSMFTMVISNSQAPGRSAQTMWEHSDLFKIGKPIKIGFSSNVTHAPEFQDQKKDWLIDGEITGIETHFTAGAQAPIIIRGYDYSHRLHRGRYNRSFQNMTDSDIVEKIAKENNIKGKGTIDPSGEPHEYVFQENQTNMEFLRERAARIGFELFVQSGEMHFRKPKQNQLLELTWLKELTSFQVRVSSAEQVKNVEVRGWDYKNKRSIIGTCAKQNIITKTEHGQGHLTSSVFQGQPSSPKLIVVDQPISTVKEAERMAEALFNEVSDEYIHADGRAQGNPQLRPGRVVKLKNMNQYSGEYYITETRHIYSERIYGTHFSMRGLRGGDLVSLLTPSNKLQPGQTLMIGVVTNNQDPDKLGRVRVKFPTLTEEQESTWARVIAIGAGKNRGFDCLPEIDDEVLVGFEHGDIHRPFVIGGLWNGNDAPPEAVGKSVNDGKVRLRTFKTRTGHTLQFTEEDQGSSKKGIEIKSVYGHRIHLNDSEKKVIIQTNGGHVVSMDDQGQKIEMKSTGSISVKANTTLDLEAGGIITVKGAMIKLN
jgi:uncharacterized protein involved in type VI secretion and phage assembly